MGQPYERTAHSPSVMFASLEYQESRARALWTSLAMHGLMLTAVLTLPLIFRDQLHLKPYDVVMLTPPPQPRQVLNTPPLKLPAPVLPREKLVPPPRPTPTVKKEEEKPRPKEPELPKPEIIKPRLEPKPKLIESAAVTPPPAPPAPKPTVHTDVFSGGNSSKTDAQTAARQVQTGGFGDPNGLPATGRPDKAANIASVGSFDLPTGPGAGNG